MRLLVVRLSAIGDCLHALPLVNGLRRQLPDVHLGWAIEPDEHRLLEGHPAVDRFHIYPREAGGGRWDRIGELLAFRRQLREEGYDVALDVQGLTKSGLVTAWSGAPKRYGYAGAESRELNRLFVNRPIPIPAGIHVVDRNLAMLPALGLELPEEPDWTLPSYAAERRAMDRALEEIGIGPQTPLAIVNPGTTWITKTWPTARFAEVARGLAEHNGLEVVVTWGGEKERSAAESIVASDPRLRLAPSTDLRHLAALTGRARLFVGNDTGPLHLAVALGVPCVAIFGATGPRRNGPYGDEHRVVVSPADLDCRPCHSKRCRRSDLACLTTIEPERVLAACADQLARALPV